MSGLGQLSNEALGRLFPIEIVPYIEKWPERFRIEKIKLKKL
jgi:hypothetical protein